MFCLLIEAFGYQSIRLFGYRGTLRPRYWAGRIMKPEKAGFALSFQIRYPAFSRAPLSGQKIWPDNRFDSLSVGQITGSERTTVVVNQPVVSMPANIESKAITVGIPDFVPFFTISFS